VITYVDTSTLLKLIVDETGSDAAEQIWTTADSLVAVSLIEVEARAALGSARRHERLSPAEHRRGMQSLRQLLDQLDIVDVTATVITTAGDLAEIHGLRGYDAVHLAAAAVVGADIVTSADRDLCAAAHREGFNIANPIDR